LSVLRFLGVVGAILLAPILAYGVWLLATPDYDGGRQAVGGMIVAAVGLFVVTFGIGYAVARRRRGTPRPL
jgi:Sec-independent protein secretion pathway component TatC